ncbi:MAG: TnpV protein [Clostridia bacterium]|nr:TnpV protein [Clostridia bacterium]
MLANILSRAVKEQGITEELKASDPLLWVQKMNQAKESAEEFVLNEMVYR